MIFLANSLTVNGGTTFLVRLCRELNRRGERCAVLCLREHGDAAMRAALAENADIVELGAYARGAILPQHFGVLGPVRWDALFDRLHPFGAHVHAMGVFSLVFALRMAAQRSWLKVSAGVYHQNEFLYEPGRLSFPNRAQQLFATLPPENVAFFNEVVRDHYRAFFGVDYDRAPVMPIGIEIPDLAPRTQPPQRPSIVSIGNLVDFKTYNRHVIGLLPQLSDVSYDIYGEGPEESALRQLAADLGVADRVSFHGHLAYERFGQTVSNATMFVGSGTALIEAAALGVPALIGIESSQEPVTYGLLSDIPGLTYNEETPTMTKRQMLPIMSAVLGDASRWVESSAACAAKSRDFSVVRTGDGFMRLGETARPLPAGAPLPLARLGAGLLTLGAAERLTRRAGFSGRRNQSFTGHRHAHGGAAR